MTEKVFTAMFANDFLGKGKHRRMGQEADVKTILRKAHFSSAIAIRFMPLLSVRFITYRFFGFCRLSNQFSFFFLPYLFSSNYEFSKALTVKRLWENCWCCKGQFQRVQEVPTRQRREVRRVRFLHTSLIVCLFHQASDIGNNWRKTSETREILFKTENIETIN